MLCKEGSEKHIKKYHLNWVGERKFDGARALLIKKGGNVWIKGRSGADYTNKFPEIVEDLKEIKGDFIFDSEICCESFERTQSRIHTENKLKLRFLLKKYPAKAHIFDILSLNNRDLRAFPLIKRALILAEMPLKSKKSLRLIERTKDLIYLWERAKKENWEGIIIKNLESKYVNGRSWNWLKIKNKKSKDIIVKKFELNPAGVRVESDEGIAVQVAGANASDVLNEIKNKGYAKIEVNYLEETKSNKLRQPTFKCLKH